MSLSQSKKKFIKSLQLKKNRREEQCFVVEGTKSVAELLSSDFEIRMVAGTPEFQENNAALLRSAGMITDTATEADLVSIGSLQSNNGAIAVAALKANREPVLQPDQYTIALDDIRDPGNVGTIIRTADWYGINTIIASEETADFYNSKTILATMGSFTRVHFFYTNLAEYLKTVGVTRYGAFLDGADVHRHPFGKGGMIVIGNESNGISADVEKYIDQKITIPRIGKAESLNAALSTAIILDNVLRSKK